MAIGSDGDGLGGGDGEGPREVRIEGVLFVYIL